MNSVAPGLCRTADVTTQVCHYVWAEKGKAKKCPNSRPLLTQKTRFNSLHRHVTAVNNTLIIYLSIWILILLQHWKLWISRWHLLMIMSFIFPFSGHKWDQDYYFWSTHADLTSVLVLDHTENGWKTRTYLVILDQHTSSERSLMSTAPD